MAIAGVFQRTFENRAEGAEALADAQVELVTDYGPKTHRQAWRTWQGDPFLLLDQPVDVEVEVEAHPGKGKQRGMIVPVHTKKFHMIGAPLFATTTKMGAGSFSLAAGPPKSVGGTCVCSALPDGYSGYRQIPGVQADQPGGRFDEQICRKCYSNKGNYMHRGSQYAQVLRYHWLAGMLADAGVDETAVALARAIDVHSRNEKRRDKKGEDPRFFRIHDSGDLFSLDYWEVWKRVCEMHGDIQFWMPTRAWWAPGFARKWGEIPENLAFRPSAYHFDDHAPVVPGMSAGSTAHYWDRSRQTDPIAQGLSDWVCPAYTGGAGKCIGALARATREWRKNPGWLQKLRGVVSSMHRRELELTDNGKDCRVCWLNRDASVSYKAH